LPRKTDTPPEGDPTLVEGTLDPETGESDPQEALTALANEVGPEAGYSVQVFKRPQDEAGRSLAKGWNRCKRIPLEGFDLDMLPELFGGGEFLLKVCNERKRFLRTHQVTFDPSVIPPEETAPAPAGVGAVPTDNTLLPLLLETRKEMAAQESRHRDFMQTLVTAMLGARSTGPSLTDMIDAQVKLRDLTRVEQPKTEAQQVVELIELGRKLAGDRGGEGEGGGDFMAGLKDLVLPILEKMQSAPRPAPRPAGELRPGAAGDNGGGVQNIPPHLLPYVGLKKFAPHLIGWAQSNFDPSRVAESLYQLVPAHELPILDQFVHEASAQRISILAQLEPALTQYRTYLDSLAVEIAKIFDSDREDDTPGEDPPYDAGTEIEPDPAAQG
jgi:hypothetical protein